LEELFCCTWIGSDKNGEMNGVWNMKGTEEFVFIFE